MFVASALAILLTWAVLTVVLTGVGSLVLRRFDRDFLLLDSFWLGLAVSVALLETWSLLLPVNSAINFLLCALAAIGLIENRTNLFRRLKSALQTARWSIPLYLATVLFVAFRASGPCDYYDTGLYGAPLVRWILTYRVVPGLANLNGRFGLNSSVFLCTGALSQGFWKGLGFHLFPGESALTKRPGVGVPNCLESEALLELRAPSCTKQIGCAATWLRAPQNYAT